MNSKSPAPMSFDLNDRQQYEAALRFVVEETVAKTGDDFYHACVRSLVDIFQVEYAFVTELVDDTCKQSRMLSLWTREGVIPPYEFDLAGTPCQTVFQNTWGIFPHSLQAKFPAASALATLEAESYLAVVIQDSQGKSIGNLGLIDTKALPDNITIAKSILQLFASRVGAEMERHADKEKLENYAISQANLYTESLAKSQELQHTLQALQRSQTQMMQSEKMSSLGQLVAGIAHEINNPVNFIHGNLSHANQYIQDLMNLVDLYQKTYPHPPASIENITHAMEYDFLREDLPKLMDSMKAGTHRIRDIVQSLRSFSRLDESAVKSVNIHDGIDSALVILQNRMNVGLKQREIKVIQQYGELPHVHCFAGQLNQVFMNLLTNAIDALEEIRSTHDSASSEPSRPPTIEISTETQGHHVSIQIKDNGIGIPPDVQPNIFNPFFTTKPVGKGTGMGLSISYQIITEQHGGELSVYSEVDQGTTFLIRIPITASIAN